MLDYCLDVRFGHFADLLKIPVLHEIGRGNCATPD
jgi:hypothetical protein